MDYDWGALGFLKHLFDRKIFDRTVKGYDAAEVKKWLGSVKEIESLRYYYYLPSSKFPRESKSLKTQPTEQVLSFLNSRFSESPDMYVEIQQKTFKSGRREIIFKGRNPKGEIVKLCILVLRRTSDETTT